MNRIIIILNFLTLIGVTGCSKSTPIPSQPLKDPVTSPEAKPGVAPTANGYAPKPVETPAPTPPSPVLGVSPSASEEMAKNPCPFGLDESHEAQELNDSGISITFACNSLKKEAFYNDWKLAKEAYPQAIALLAKNRLALTKAKRPPQTIEIDYQGEPSKRIVSEANTQTWRMTIKLAGAPNSIDRNLDYFLALDQSFGAYELKNFPKLTTEVEGSPREDLLNKITADRQFRAVKEMMETNRVELKNLSDRGLKSLQFAMDYKLELRPHRLTLKKDDSLTGVKNFISEFPLRNFFGQRPELQIEFQAGPGIAAKRDLSMTAAKMFAKSIQDFIAAAQSLKKVKITHMDFALLPGDVPSKKNNQIQHYHGDLKIHMKRPDNIYPADVDAVLKQIKSLDLNKE